MPNRRRRQQHPLAATDGLARPHLIRTERGAHDPLSFFFYYFFFSFLNNLILRPVPLPIPPSDRRQEKGERKKRISQGYRRGGRRGLGRKRWTNAKRNKKKKKRQNNRRIEKRKNNKKKKNITSFSLARLHATSGSQHPTRNNTMAKRKREEERE